MVHDIPVQIGHFHEVGVLDAIAGGVGVVAGLAALKEAFSDRHDVPIAAVCKAALAAWHARRLGGAEPIEAAG